MLFESEVKEPLVAKSEKEHNRSRLLLVILLLSACAPFVLWASRSHVGRSAREEKVVGSSEMANRPARRSESSFAEEKVGDWAPTTKAATQPLIGALAKEQGVFTQQMLDKAFAKDVPRVGFEAEVHNMKMRANAQFKNEDGTNCDWKYKDKLGKVSVTQNGAQKVLFNIIADDACIVEMVSVPFNAHVPAEEELLGCALVATQKALDNTGPGKTLEQIMKGVKPAAAKKTDWCSELLYTLDVEYSPQTVFGGGWKNIPRYTVTHEEGAYKSIDAASMRVLCEGAGCRENRFATKAHCAIAAKRAKAYGECAEYFTASTEQFPLQYCGCLDSKAKAVAYAKDADKKQTFKLDTDLKTPPEYRITGKATFIMYQGNVGVPFHAYDPQGARAKAAGGYHKLLQGLSAPFRYLPDREADQILLLNEPDSLMRMFLSYFREIEALQIYRAATWPDGMSEQERHLSGEQKNLYFLLPKGLLEQGTDFRDKLTTAYKKMFKTTIDDKLNRLFDCPRGRAGCFPMFTHNDIIYTVLETRIKSRDKEETIKKYVKPKGTNFMMLNLEKLYNEPTQIVKEERIKKWIAGIKDLQLWDPTPPPPPPPAKAAATPIDGGRTKIDVTPGTGLNLGITMDKYNKISAINAGLLNGLVHMHWELTEVDGPTEKAKVKGKLKTAIDSMKKFAMVFDPPPPPPPVVEAPVAPLKKAAATNRVEWNLPSGIAKLQAKFVAKSTPPKIQSIDKASPLVAVAKVGWELVEVNGQAEPPNDARQLLSAALTSKAGARLVFLKP